MKGTWKAIIAVNLSILMNLTACAANTAPAGEALSSVSEPSAVSGTPTISETSAIFETSGTSAASGAVVTSEKPVISDRSATSKEGVKVDVLLTGAPELHLSDALSSTVNDFGVRSGNYEWNYLENNEVVSIVACGSYPLDIVLEEKEKLRIKQYNRMDFTSYIVSCVVPPDRLTVREWDISQLGNMDAEEEGEVTVTVTVTYDEALIIQLKADKIYEINAQWDEAGLESNGFYGSASYVIVTE